VHPLHLWHEQHPLTVLRQEHPWPFAFVTGALVFALGIGLDLIADGHAQLAHVSAAVALGWFAGIGVASSRTRAKRPR
jgi:hypothetical protein